MSYSRMVMEDVSQYSALEIIDAQKVHKEKFEEMPEATFYKALSRLAKDGEIGRITKGIYCKPKKGKCGTTISSEKDILAYFLGKEQNKGVVIGRRLFNKYGLVAQVSKGIEIYSNVTNQEKRIIKNVTIKKANLNFDTTTIKMIELLEILQEHQKIEGLNTNSLIAFIEEAVKCYNEKTVERIIEAVSYKKSTLASLRNILDFFNVENNINKYLNGISKYKAIDMKSMYEVAL